MGRTKQAKPTRLRHREDVEGEKTETASMQAPTVRCPTGAAAGSDGELRAQHVRGGSVQRKRRRIMDESEEEEIMDVNESMDPGEVEILRDESSTIVLHPPSARQDGVVQAWTLLENFPLKDREVLVELEGQRIALSKLAYQIKTMEGAQSLFRSVCTAFGKIDHDVGLAIDDQTLCMFINSDTVELCLSDQSFEACSPQTLPQGKTKFSKVMRKAQTLFRVLATLSGSRVIHEDRSKLQKSLAPPVSAAMVYQCTDNVQVNAWRARKLSAQELSVPGLVPTLRPYQQAAVDWMLKREKGMGESCSREWEILWVAFTEDLTVLPMGDLSSKVRPLFYMSPFLFWIVQTYREAELASVGQTPKPIRGGILADQMGLGKTVSTIALVLSNQRELISRSRMAEAPDHRTVPLFVEDDQNPPSTQNNPDSEPKANSGKGCWNPEMGQATLARTELVRKPIPVTSEKKKQTRKIRLMTNCEFGVCICGLAGRYRGCLGFVICKECQEPMHGLCAGFSNAEGLEEETETTIVSVGTKQGSLLRYCSAERCPSCRYKFAKRNGLVESRATLIITPPSILSQWKREIEMHTNLNTRLNRDENEFSGSIGSGTKRPLKVVVYPGVRGLFRKKKANNMQHCRHLIHPKLLADADVVLMTFDALRDDLGHSGENPFVDGERQNLRARKKYRVVPSPVTSIKWWRVCLDEAQRVESPTADSARMALKLETYHRWCISGTPIGRGRLEDLYGLLLFLRLNPFASKPCFDRCFHPGTENVLIRVQSLLQNIFWRSTKADVEVREQMGVPEQVEQKVILRFSSIEKHFYERQLESTLEAASNVVGKLSEMTGARRRKDMKLEVLSQQLHRLRAACCHPQVGSSGIGKATKRLKAGKQQDGSHISVGSGVLSMDQILDRLIDDAKGKCEEAQRITILHANAMAALSRLKIEARGAQGVLFSDSDIVCMSQSCRTYLDSLKQMEANAWPTSVVGESRLTGSHGFQLQNQLVRDGKASLAWKLLIAAPDTHQGRSVWARFDFEGPMKKVNEIRVRPISTFDSFHEVARPKDCVLQVAHGSLGGMFVDALSFTLGENQTESVSLSGFRTNKSKSWRLLIKNFHGDLVMQLNSSTVLVGVQIELMEASIAFDALQQLHILCNCSTALTDLQLLKKTDNNDSKEDIRVLEMTKLDIENKVEAMREESETIEELSMAVFIAPHKSSKTEVSMASQKRKHLESKLLKLSSKQLGKRRKQEIGADLVDFICDGWWEDLLGILHMNATPQDCVNLCQRVVDDMEQLCGSAWNLTNDLAWNYKLKPLPAFRDVWGLQTALGLRMTEIRDSIGFGKFDDVMDRVIGLSSHPGANEVTENSQCGHCHAYFHQTGPTCHHCKLEEALRAYDLDRVMLKALSTIWKWLKDRKRLPRQVSSLLRQGQVEERARVFFDALDAFQREWSAAKLHWKVHLELLNAYDELTQSKRVMRLISEGEDVSQYAQEELNSMVLPIDISSRYMEHSVKRDRAAAMLERSTQTLRFLRNQGNQNASERDDVVKRDEDSCSVCLQPFGGERAVLKCGHSFHYSPCLEKIMVRCSGGGESGITCPFKCRIRTRKSEVMIATNKRKDDGSKCKREIEGGWGTKVTRLVCDLLDARDQGDKSLVFSQWEDMMDVVEHALVANEVSYVRVASMDKIAEAIQKFRSAECWAMLLNVKNGAEGLTLVEATHVFMIEPLLNCGLDAQAINRVHRIGQTSKTYVHRYLIDETIEPKIDQLRMEREATDGSQVEDSIQEAKKKHAVSAGGIDGGFSMKELQDLLE